ncbi:hypothetical protein T09_13434 [Trichinella sp. T9]|nr:hypothetical protein T09_13434 [Trichinella sp. T9]
MLFETKKDNKIVSPYTPSNYPLFFTAILLYLYTFLYLNFVQRRHLKILIILNVILLVLISNCYFNKIYFSERTYESTYQLLIQNHIELYEKIQQKDKFKNLNLENTCVGYCYLNPTKRWCWKLPSFPVWILSQMNHFNWQSVNSLHVGLFLLNAYLDSRLRSENIKAVVQILAMGENDVRSTPFCFLWMSVNDTYPIVVRARVMQIWQKAWDPRPNFYFPYLISCPLENGEVFPKYVTIENAQCPHGYSNLLPVVLPASVDPKRHTVVCVKGLDYSDDRSARLIEWIEANLLLGADKLTVYTYNVHPNMEKVLHYYQNKGYVLHVSSSLPGNQPHSAWQRSRFIALNSQQKRRNEILLYNDCLYRHLNSHIYVLPIDLDELLVPIGGYRNWDEIVKFTTFKFHKTESNLSALCARNAFYFDQLSSGRGNLHISVPRKMHMLRHRFRSSQISNAGYYSKCFMRVDNVETAFNHFPFHKIRTALEPTLFFATEVALKNHYKDACPKELTDDKCDKLMNDSIMDYNLAAFQQQLVHRFRKVCAELQFPTD